MFRDKSKEGGRGDRPQKIQLGKGIQEGENNAKLDDDDANSKIHHPWHFR